MTDNLATSGRPWQAPTPAGPLNASVVLPGSKSQTSRALVIGTLAQAPTLVRQPLAARDTWLAAKAMQQFGATLEFPEDTNDVIIHGPTELRGAGKVDCGLAGTVMRFGAALAGFAKGKTTLYGDPHAEQRPLKPLLDALKDLGAKVKYRGRKGYLPVRIRGPKAKATSVFSEDALGQLPKQKEEAVSVDTSSSSQYLSALLLASPLMPAGTIIRSEGLIPSWPYVAMSIDMLKDQGVRLTQLSSASWRTDATRPAGNPITIEPDLANAGPFMAAALLSGGCVTVRDWPDSTDQVGKYWLEVLPQFGAQLEQTSEGLRVCAPVGHTWPGLELDMAAYGELAPTVAALCAFATSPSMLLGIGHLRGHETDRLAALANEINKLGGRATVLDDGLHIVPRPMRPTTIESYEDHRMATFGALIGLRLPGCSVTNIETTAKTLPDFVARWQAMIEGSPSPQPLHLRDVMADPSLVEG